MTNQSNIITYEIDQKVKELAEANAHIPAEEIRQDIAGTEAEIQTYLSRQKGWEVLHDFKRAEKCRIQVEKREKFIEKLKCILEYRERKKKEN